jgi:hypothetical protein
MLELMVAVVSFQYLATIRQPKPDAIWLANEGLKTSHCQSADTGGAALPQSSNCSASTGPKE